MCATQFHNVLVEHVPVSDPLSAPFTLIYSDDRPSPSSECPRLSPSQLWQAHASILPILLNPISLLTLMKPSFLRGTACPPLPPHTLFLCSLMINIAAHQIRRSKESGRSCFSGRQGGQDLIPTLDVRDIFHISKTKGRSTECFTRLLV